MVVDHVGARIAVFGGRHPHVGGLRGSFQWWHQVLHAQHGAKQQVAPDCDCQNVHSFDCHGLLLAKRSLPPQSERLAVGCVPMHQIITIQSIKGQEPGVLSRYFIDENQFFALYCYHYRMSEHIKDTIKEVLHQAGVTGVIELSSPPKADMGDFAFACFGLAKQQGKKPNDIALELVVQLHTTAYQLPTVERVEAFGPYVNFFLNGPEMARLVLDQIHTQGALYGSHTIGAHKKYLVEFGCPNPLKAFHLGHLKNLITGESVVRVFENAGYTVVRTNYQGDVGMHVAKALWGIFNWRDQFEAARSLGTKQRAEFLGKAYAHGATYFESGEKAQQEVVKFNDIVYEYSDADVMSVYTEARQWSLDYFDEIYARLGTRYDRMYFESDMFKRGVVLVQEGMQKGIFAQGDGALIFPGSQYDLHDRVFINSKGFPTYEAKELALAEKHFADYNPDAVIHVVGKEQTEYFKVIIKALELALPQTAGKEVHLVGGFLQLKGDQKMSSRKGNIVTGDELLEEVRERVEKIMVASEHEKPIDTAAVADAVSVAALKYGMLKNNVSQDVSFDLEESLSVTGDSGAYLLYLVARIKSILRKVDKVAYTNQTDVIEPAEKQLLLKLANFPAVTQAAVESYDPSKIAKYLFELAQKFTSFYEACPVLKSDEATKNFRLTLITSVLNVMERGLYLLGIETVEEM